jgi:hypothetical protein
MIEIIHVALTGIQPNLTTIRDWKYDDSNGEAGRSETASVSREKDTFPFFRSKPAYFEEDR